MTESECEILYVDKPEELFETIVCPEMDWGLSDEAEEMLREKAPDDFLTPTVEKEKNLISADDDRGPLEILREEAEGDSQEILTSDEEVLGYRGEEYEYYCMDYPGVEVEFREFDTTSFAVDEPQNVFVTGVNND